MNIKGIAMGKQTVLHSPWARLILVIAIIAAGLGAMVSAPVREKVYGLFAAKIDGHQSGAGADEGAVLIQIMENQGLRLSEETVAGLNIQPVKAILATKERALPRQPGQVMYDPDRLFPIPSRFPGELAEFAQVQDTDDSVSPTHMRPIRFGDKVKQGDLLAVIWSQQLGTYKAALVDGISALRLSQEALNRYEKLMEAGVGSESNFKAAIRQVEADTTTYNSAERSLRMWKLTDEEIDAIKAEAKSILDKKQARSPVEEAKKWARVEVRVPVDKANPKRELMVVEKSTNLNSMVDPINSPPLFKLADTSRLQIWVQPPEEYLPLLDERLQKYGPGRLKWDIHFPMEPPGAPPHKLDIIQIAPSYDPNLRTPLVVGYLPNPEGKYRVGQPVTATIYVPPDENTVEIPTDAVNQVEGQDFVFVQTDPKKREYALRRVAVVRRFKDVTFVRTLLTNEDKRTSDTDVARGRRPLQPLLPGEQVVTGGIVQLTACLEDLATKEKVAGNKRKRLAENPVAR
jgi:cobalt-zinc-cadmium efflux system membrane fusion protein